MGFTVNYYYEPHTDMPTLVSLKISDLLSAVAWQLHQGSVSLFHCLSATHHKNQHKNKHCGSSPNDHVCDLTVTFLTTYMQLLSIYGRSKSTCGDYNHKM